MFVVRGLTHLDRLFIPDDTYYTLAIARSLAQGLGPSADGVTLTSGFQPLIAFLLVPVFRITGSLDAPVYATCIFGALADAASIFLLGHWAARLAGKTAGLATALIWALSSLAISNSLNGLETALALCMELALVAAWPSADKGIGARHLVLTGVLAGVTLLARIDAVFLLLPLAAMELFRRRWRTLLLIAAAATVVVAPWWTYCLVRFGSPIPASGEAVRHLVELHQRQYLTLPWALGWGSGSLLGAPFADWAALKEFASSDPIWGFGLFALYALLFALATRRLILQRAGWFSPFTAFAAFAAILALFYVGYLPAAWFFRRYLAPVHAFHALCIGIAAAVAWQHASRSRKLRIAFSASAALVLTALIAPSVLLVIARPTGSADSGLHGAKGYAEVARQVLSVTPKCAVLGALQSGALSYYARGCPLIVGLDGVVDPAAARAVRDGTLADYAAQRGVTHFADWPYNRGAFGYFSRAAKNKVTSVQPLGAAKPQGSDRFELFAVSWPEGAIPANHARSRCCAVRD
jgi:hypothetical protein